MLSEKAKDALRIAIANNDEADEVIAELEKLEAVAEIAEIADPGTATAEDCANKINEILQALA